MSATYLPIIRLTTRGYVCSSYFSHNSVISFPSFSSFSSFSTSSATYLPIIRNTTREYVRPSYFNHNLFVSSPSSSSSGRAHEPLHVKEAHSWKRLTSYILLGGIGAFGAISTLIINLPAPTPAPAAFAIACSIGNKYVTYCPRLEINFGNFGSAPMFVDSVQWYVDGEAVPFIGDSIIGKQGKNWIITSESYVSANKDGELLFRGNSSSDPGNITSICTIKPNVLIYSPLGADWITQFREVCSYHDLHLLVKYRYKSCLPAYWPFQKTVKFYPLR